MNKGSVLGLLEYNDTLYGLMHQTGVQFKYLSHVALSMVFPQGSFAKPQRNKTPTFPENLLFDEKHPFIH